MKPKGHRRSAFRIQQAGPGAFRGRWQAGIWGRNPRTTVIRAGALVCGAAVLFGWILVPVRLSGISMQPTYRDGALNFANRAAYWLRQPARGDVVAIRMAGASAVYVKRIVGMPGERLEIVQGVVSINGHRLPEPAVVRQAAWSLAPVSVGADEYFVAGDNRSMAMEDHALGRVRRSRVRGKLLF